MIATTINQSKELVRLGLDPSTADMSYSEEYYGRDNKGNDEWRWQLNACKFIDVEGITPAWSLSSLLDVMPGVIKADGKQYYFHLEKVGLKYGKAYDVSYYFDDVDELYELHTTPACDDPVSAAYEMVCWLLTNKYIKKGD